MCCLRVFKMSVTNEKDSVGNQGKSESRVKVEGR